MNDPVDELRVEANVDGIIARKTFEPDEFPVPVIRLELENSHEKPVSLRLEENIPESFQMDAIGFHPEYHSNRWTAYEDNHLEFETTLDEREHLETVYGVRLDDQADAAAFFDPPEIEVAVDDETLDSSESGASVLDDSLLSNIVDPAGSQAIRDMIRDDGSVPGLEDRTDADDEESHQNRDDGDGIELDIDAARERVLEAGESSEEIRENESDATEPSVSTDRPVERRLDEAEATIDQLTDRVATLTDRLQTIERTVLESDSSEHRSETDADEDE